MQGNEMTYINEMNQVVDANGNLILNEYNQPTYFYGKAYRYTTQTQQQQPYPYNNMGTTYGIRGVSTTSGNPHSIVFGIIGICIGWLSPIFGIIFGILAIVYASKAKRTDLSAGTPGIVLGIISLVIALIMFMLTMYIRLSIFN